MQLAIQSPAASPIRFAGRRLQTGLCGLAYFHNFNPFLNWWKIASFEVGRTAGGPLTSAAAFSGGYVDANGELHAGTPTDAVDLYGLFYDPNTLGPVKLNNESFTVFWDGSPSAVSFGQTATVNLATKTATVVFKANQGGASIRLTIDPANRADPPRNVRIVQTRYLNDVTLDGITYKGFTNGGKFNPHWLHQMRKFKTLRFMDWMQTNGSPIATYSQIADEAYYRWGLVLGQKYGAPLSLICEIAQLTGCDVHVCIPHQLDDAGVTSLVTHFRDNMPAGPVVLYEFSNECWNNSGSFTQTSYCTTQGTAIWGSGDNARGSKWYGYRSAQCMKIIRDLYGTANRSRWRGVIGTQTVNTGVTNAALTGINYWRANVLNPANSLTVADLFDRLSVTGYFGDVVVTKPITAITKEANALVTTGEAHGYAVGTRLRFGFRAQDGMGELNNVTATVTDVPTTTTYRIDIDTTNYTALTGASSANRYSCRAAAFDLIEASIARFNAGLEPTKYQYFNKQLAQALETGTCSSGLLTQAVFINDLQNTYWPDQKAIADANGLVLDQYEGGFHFTGGIGLTGYSDDNVPGALFTEFMIQAGHSLEVAAIYSKVYRAFTAIGGVYPSKFVEAGQTTRFGAWPGIRHFPCADDLAGDFGNPVWKATLAASAAYFKA